MLIHNKIEVNTLTITKILIIFFKIWVTKVILTEFYY